MSNELTNQQVDQANAAQLARAMADTKAFHALQDGKDLLEALAELPDTRPE
jgi:hypothetical protein